MRLCMDRVTFPLGNVYITKTQILREALLMYTFVQTCTDMQLFTSFKWMKTSPDSFVS